MGKLTAHGIRKLAPGKHADGGGLYLFADAREQDCWRWYFIFSWPGRKYRCEMSIGALRDFNLADAREEAARARALVRSGVNPIEARKSAVKLALGATVGDVADEWFAQKKLSLRNPKSVSMLKRDVEVLLADIRKVPVAQISVDDVLHWLLPIWKESHDKGRRLREKLESILDAATARGLRTGDNPARWRGHLQHLLPVPPKLEKKHHPAMPYKNMPAFFEKLQTTDSISARALEFCILTAARTAEVIGALWSEIDLDEKVWSIPAKRMKSGRAHVVPLPAAAIDILDKMKAIRVDDGVFPSRKKDKRMAHDALAQALIREGVTDYTVHGFRSAFRDWAGNETQFPREVAEAALAHAVGDEVERAYRRGDALAKRCQLMEAWAAFVAPTTQTSE